MKDVQCYELFGGIALKNHAFSFFSFSVLSAKNSYSDEKVLLALFTFYTNKTTGNGLKDGS